MLDGTLRALRSLVLSAAVSRSGAYLRFPSLQECFGTGGPVGPEGSAFAFLAVVIGFGFLVLTVRADEGGRYLEH